VNKMFTVFNGAQGQMELIFFFPWMGFLFYVCQPI
jgi:hypothetical protein